MSALSEFTKARTRSTHVSELKFGKREGSPSSEVTVRRATEQELAALDAKLGKVAPKMNPQIKTTKETVPMSKWRKEDYLKLRAEGMSREEIATQWGMKKTSLEGNLLSRWGVFRADDELKAIRVFLEVEMPPRVEPLVVTTPVVPREEPAQAAAAEEDYAPEEPADVTAPEEPEEISEVPPTPAPDKRALISLVLDGEQEAPDCAESYADLTQTQLMRLGIRIVRTAVARAVGDARELLGRNDVTDVVQAFVDRCAGDR